MSSASSRNDVTSLKSTLKEDSEDDCFESAEESLEEDERNDIESERNLRDYETELPACVPSHNNSVKSLHQAKEEMSGNLMSYRKRPERVKRQHSNRSSNTTSKSPTELTFKADKIVSDVFLQDITSNLTKNINRSLSTIQQTSTNVKELIFSAVPVSCHNNNKGFTYDDKDAYSTSAGTFLDNKQFESVGNMGDHLKNKEETCENKLSSEEVSFSLADEKNKNVEDRKLSITGTKIKTNEMPKYDMEPIVSEDTGKKEHNLEEQPKLKSPESASESKTETKVIEIENSIDSCERSINNQNLEILKPNDQEGLLSKENSFMEVVKYFQNGNTVINKLEINNEISHELNVSKNENAEKQNSKKENFVSCPMVENSFMIQKNSSSPSANAETSENLETTAEEDVNNKSEEKPDDDSECALKSLKTALKNIINDEKEGLENIKNSNEDFGEGEFIFKGKMVDNETSNEGWDDFDFSDSETDNTTFTKDNVNIKEESEIMGNKQVKKNKIVLTDVQSSDDSFMEDKCKINILKKKNLEIGSTQPSFPAVDNFNIEKVIKKGKSLVKDNVKKDIIEIKPVPEDVWDWDSWDDGPESKEKIAKPSEANTLNLEKAKDDSLDISKWSGWDSFGQKSEEKPKNWGLGSWGVDMLLNKASTVTQGISNVLEAGLGAPDPETLARMEKMEKGNVKEHKKNETEAEKQPLEVSKKNSLTNVNIFPVTGIKSLVAEVTSKIVEHSKIQEIGSKVISGGLDTLETFGKKTMEVLQEGDPGLKNKRALLLGDQKPVLSQVLREAREKADRELKKEEEREFAKKCHFETLFDDFQGMVHLEALEMLSRQYELKLDQLRSGKNSEELEDFNSILEEVEQLCSLDEYDMDLKSSSKLDFKIKLEMAVKPLKNEISTYRIIQIHDEVSNWLQTAGTTPSLLIKNQKLVSTLAELTAATVQQFHKSGELLSVKECRKTVEEVDALLRLTNVLCEEINILCETFITFFKKGNDGVDEEKMNSILENLTVIRRNSISYIRQAFNLLMPVLQFGAAVY